MNRIATSLFALGIAATTLTAGAQYYGPQGPPPPPAYGQGGGGWDAPPREFTQVRRQGFLDGIYGAQQDFKNHRPPNPNNRDEYRKPHVAPFDRREYRIGFRRGYEVGVQHTYGNGPRPY